MNGQAISNENCSGNGIVRNKEKWVSSPIGGGIGHAFFLFFILYMNWFGSSDTRAARGSIHAICFIPFQVIRWFLDKIEF